MYMKKNIRKILKMINITQLVLFIIIALLALIIYIQKGVLFYDAILKNEHFASLSMIAGLIVLYGLIEVFRFIIIRPIYKLYILICILIVAFTEMNDSLFTVAVIIVLVVAHIYTHFIDDDYEIIEKKEEIGIKKDDEII